MSMVMIMAGGTGGHVMPALAVAEQLRGRGVEIRWIGNADSMEARVAESAGIALDVIRIRGLRRSGLRRKLAMPLQLLGACREAWSIIRKTRPDLLLGMGGFVSGPGGLVARLTGTPLVLHEQNAVAGLTNRTLARVAHRVLCGFPKARNIVNAEFIGNPVRAEIAAIESPASRLAERTDGLRVLVIGGSQGAQVFNDSLPSLLASAEIDGLEIWHQSGRGRDSRLRVEYGNCGCNARVTEFIDDMAAAYRWSDVVICRAGAMTVAEISAAGAVALFVPYPHAVNDHQTLNAKWLTDADAALLFPQADFVRGTFLASLNRFTADRPALVEMAKRARAMARTDAASRLADICEEVINA